MINLLIQVGPHEVHKLLKHICVLRHLNKTATYSLTYLHNLDPRGPCEIMSFSRKPIIRQLVSRHNVNCNQQLLPTEEESLILTTCTCCKS